MSTAGAGVASILSTEAAVLNPAASTFFQGSSFSYQSYRTTLQRESDVRDTLPDQFPRSNRSQGAFMSDHSGPVKGGAAFITQDENNFERQRLVMHGSAPIGGATSVGFSYSYIQDQRQIRFRDRYQIHHQGTVGLTHIVDEDTVLGVVLIDPTRTTPGEERAIAGFQYTLADRFTLLGDVGIRYTRRASEDYLWRGGVQMNIFSDFFLKVGQSFDNISKLKGTGWGVSWIGPRLGVEFAQRYSEQFDSGYYVYKDERIVDTSLSAIIKF
jgi:hypothetical protein